jgi:hypothetical protein
LGERGIFAREKEAVLFQTVREKKEGYATVILSGRDPRSSKDRNELAPKERVGLGDMRR